MNNSELEENYEQFKCTSYLWYMNTNFSDYRFGTTYGIIKSSPF
jgi:hypothetical protein